MSRFLSSRHAPARTECLGTSMMKEMMNDDPEKILDFLDEISRLAPPELEYILYIGGVIMKKPARTF